MYICWMVLNVILSLSFRHYCGQTLIVALNRGKVIYDGRKLRIRASCITVRLNDAIKRVQSHACMSFAEHEHLRCWKHQFVKFVLKIVPNRCPKFGSARKMLYLCNVNRWSSESHESSLSNGRVATEMDEVNQKTGAQSKWETKSGMSATRCSWPQVNLILC